MPTKLVAKEQVVENIRMKLQSIQENLAVPKGQYNSFGKYRYRKCEDILEAVKPLLSNYGCAITLNDEIVQIGDRFYVRATATLLDIADESQISVQAFAREAEDKKGMDEAQITGSSSSYARKYALSGLLAIDDEKDADTEEPKKPHQAPVGYTASAQVPAMPAPQSVMTDKQLATIQSLALQVGMSKAEIETKIGKPMTHLSSNDASSVIKKLMEKVTALAKEKTQVSQPARDTGMSDGDIMADQIMNDAFATGKEDELYLSTLPF